MANPGASVNGSQGTAGFSMSKAVEDVSHHSSAQTEALKENQRILAELQASLSETEKRAEVAERRLKSTLRELLTVEAELEELQQGGEALRSRCASLSADNTRLLVAVREREEEAAAALGGFTAYRGKMQAHRAALALAACRTQEHKVLEESRVLVRRLTQQRDELREDLDNPEGSAARREKEEAQAVEEEVSRRRRAVVELSSRLQEELQTQAQIREDIEIQNKRCEAIIKRRRCQLSRVQAERRQLSEEIRHLEKQLAELKRPQRESD